MWDTFHRYLCGFVELFVGIYHWHVAEKQKKEIFKLSTFVCHHSVCDGVIIAVVLKLHFWHRVIESTMVCRCGKPQQITHGLSLAIKCSSKSQHEFGLHPITDSCIMHIALILLTHCRHTKHRLRNAMKCQKNNTNTSDIERFYRDRMLRSQTRDEFTAIHLKNNCNFRWTNIGYLSIKLTIWLTKWIHTQQKQHRL